MAPAASANRTSLVGDSLDMEGGYSWGLPERQVKASGRIVERLQLAVRCVCADKPASQATGENHGRRANRSQANPASRRRGRPDRMEAYLLQGLFDQLR